VILHPKGTSAALLSKRTCEFKIANLALLYSDRPPERHLWRDRGGWVYDIPYRHPLLRSLDSGQVLWSTDLLLYFEWINTGYLLAG
jgi:hypothetical protein